MGCGLARCIPPQQEPQTLEKNWETPMMQSAFQGSWAWEPARGVVRGGGGNDNNRRPDRNTDEQLEGRAATCDGLSRGDGVWC